ncbi:MAG: ZIP family metal transporter [Patescibacteria group bacterium]|jgi:ZIP family zinc transporter
MDTGHIIKILLLSLISGAATLIGVVIGRHANRRGAVLFGASFAAGIMILISLFELIPSSFESGKPWITIFFLVGGAALLWLANTILPHLHTIKECDSYDSKSMIKMAYLLAIGLILHDFPEGFAIPSSFGHSEAVGLIVVIGTFIHNIPEGYMLTAANTGSCNFFYKSAIFSALSTLTGTIFGLILLNKFHFLNPIFLAVAAGAMLFIAFHELIPFIKNIGRREHGSYLGFVASVAVYLLLILIF